jgi:phage terminase small subunit
MTDKQKRFCEEYVKDWNGTRAAIAAGYSEKTADVISSQNLGKLKVKEYINTLTSNYQKQLNISIITQVEKLTEMMGNDDTRTRDQLEILKEIHKLLGLYPSEKKDINLNSTIPLFPNIK